MPLTQEERRAQTRTLLLTSAAELFARKGFHATSAEAVAAAAVQRHVLPLVEQGVAHVPVDATFPLADAAEAYEHFRAGGKFGKVVLVAP